MTWHTKIWKNRIAAYMNFAVVQVTVGVLPCALFPTRNQPSSWISLWTLFSEGTRWSLLSTWPCRPSWPVPPRITMVTWSTRGARSAWGAGGAGNSDRNGASTAWGTRFIGLWKSIGINWFSWSEEMRKKRVYHLLQNHATSAGSGCIKPCLFSVSEMLI